MNCLEFRRLCLVDPRRHDPGLAAHARSCAPCAQFAREQDERERALRAALQVEAPEGLAARVLLRQSFARRRRPQARLAMAASLVLALGAGLYAWQWLRAPTLASEVFAHVRAEPESLVAAGPVSGAQVDDVLHTLGARVAGEIGEIRYAGLCDIARRPGGHLVVAGTQGPVTLLLLPAEQVARAERWRDGAFEALLVPTGRGALAVVGLPGEPLAAIAERLRLRFVG
jgi:hypothetical protein